MSETKNKRNPLLVILTLVAIIGATSFWYFALYAPIDFEHYSDNGTYHVLAADTNASAIVVNFDADVGEFDIKLFDGATSNSEAINATWVYSYLMDSKHGDAPAMTVETTNQTVDNVLYVTISVDYDQSHDWFEIVDYRFDVFLSPNFDNYSIIGDFAASSVNVNMENITIQTLNLDSNAGSFDITLHDIALVGDVILATDAGSMSLDLENIVSTGENSIQIDTSAGSIELDWLQNLAIGDDLTIDLSTSAGSIEMDLNVVNSNKIDLQTTTSVGSENIHYDDGENIGEGHVQTEDFDLLALPAIFIQAETSVGSIDISIDTI